MAEGSGDSGSLPMLGTDNPASYRSPKAKQRFAVAKYYGMGSDGSWQVSEIADALDVSERQVYRYLNESEIGKETREALATTEAEWRLDMAIQLRREVDRLEAIEKDLLKRQKTVATGFEVKTVEGTPTGDQNIRLPDDTDTYRLKLPVPTDFETVTHYGPDLEKVQKEKRQYLRQIADLLGLEEADKRGVDESLAGQVDEVKIVEVRRSEDPYPEAEMQDMRDPESDAETVETDAIDVEYTEAEGPDDDT